ncbi:hypothetical protein L2E82_14686 [Cichorium intybus]|uniref:Uncharacterized protein n=1 Tax=Cichorium intybus TaxID=13427 RepID=A0ACB9F1B2_CICIN|nr:hypothetical protein L2E82_14686 [Cichorium intybus]
MLTKTHTGRAEFGSRLFQTCTGRVEFHTGRVDLTEPLNVQKMLISGKNTPNSILELPKAIFHQIEPWDAWGNVWRLQSNPVNTFTIPKSSRLLVDAFRVIDYGDITNSSEQDPGTHNLGVPNTELTSGICSSDR